MVESLSAAVHAHPDAASAYRAVAERLVELAGSPTPGRPRFSLALSGGATPERLFRLLANEYEGRLAWAEIDVGFADERAVPPDDARSNFALARRTLLDPLAVPAEHVHRIRGELRPTAEAARAYESDLRTLFPDGRDSFDTILLGVGPDGHTASLFPGAATLAEPERWVRDEPAPALEPKVPRITLTLPALAAARRVLFLVLGAEKRTALTAVLGDPRRGTSAAALPAARVQAREGVEWYVDSEAAPDLASPARD